MVWDWKLLVLSIFLLTDWTIPLHLDELFTAASTMYKLAIPPCLLMVCLEPGDKWTVDEDLAYGN